MVLDLEGAKVIFLNGFKPERALNQYLFFLTGILPIFLSH